VTACRAPARASRLRHPPRYVRFLVKRGDDHHRHRFRVGEPIPTGFKPSTALHRQFRVWTRSRQPYAIGSDLLHRQPDGCGQIPSGLGAVFPPEVTTQLSDLYLRGSRENYAAGDGRFLFACARSSSSSSASSSLRNSSASTTRPAAASASPRSSASIQAAGARRGLESSIRLNVAASTATSTTPPRPNPVPPAPSPGTSPAAAPSASAGPASAGAAARPPSPRRPPAPPPPARGAPRRAARPPPCPPAPAA